MAHGAAYRSFDRGHSRRHSARISDRADDSRHKSPSAFALVIAVRAVVVGLILVIGGMAILARLSGQPGFDAWSLLGLLLFAVPVAIVLGLPVTSLVSMTAMPNLGSAGLVRRLSNARDAQATVE